MSVALPVCPSVTALDCLQQRCCNPLPTAPESEQSQRGSNPCLHLERVPERLVSHLRICHLTWDFTLQRFAPFCTVFRPLTAGDGRSSGDWRVRRTCFVSITTRLRRGATNNNASGQWTRRPHLRLVLSTVASPPGSSCRGVRRIRRPRRECHWFTSRTAAWVVAGVPSLTERS